VRIGIVTTWFERGAAYVSRQYRDLLRRQGNGVFIYARGGERYAVGDPNWDTPEVTWGEEPEVDAITAVNKRDFLGWISANKLEAVIFNEQWWLPPVLWTRDMGCKAIAYVDYYTERTVPLFAIYDGLICNTKRHADVFTWHSNCLYVPWGTDVTLFHPVENMPRTGKGPVFFHSAGISPARKGTDLVLRAFAGLPGDASLVLHIQGVSFREIPDMRPLADELTRQGRLKIYDEEVPAPGLYHLGDVYVYPSRLEGIGLSQAEALACGLPLIVPDNPPMNEFISPESGVAVPVEKLWARADGYYWPQCQADLDGLTSAMRSFMDDFASLEERKRAARAYAERRLDWFENGRRLGGWLEELPRRELPQPLILSVRKEERKTPPASYARLKQFPAVWKRLKSFRGGSRRR
jgi:glycosyltransferase involved in cell wall biosynthesis